MSSRRAKIWLIEHDELLTEITAFRLELLGHQVDAFTTGQQVLALLDAALPDLIILDPELPDMVGLALVTHLRNSTRTRDIPVMILSTSGEVHDVQLAHAAGATDYLVVPYDPTTLKQKVTQLLERVALTH